MFKIMVEDVTYKLCEKCGTYRKPQSFKVKKQKRKSCSNCRSKKVNTIELPLRTVFH